VTELGEFGMWLAIGGASIGFWTVMLPIAKAAARRLEGRVPDQVLARIEALEQRTMNSGEVDLTRQRIAELEERVDFAERMLAQPRDAARIPGETPG
jgi:hypothetical protein